MTEQSPFAALTQDADAAAYLAQARRTAGAVPSGARDPASIARVGVLGAGAMGRGIAMAFAQTGRQVAMVDPAADALASARAHLGALADRDVAKGRLDAAGRDDLMARFDFFEDLSAFSEADMVVEAVPEILSLKQRVMAEIERVVAPGTIIATNTSTLDVDAIAGALAQPARFVGTHFFIPAQVNPLLEVIPAKTTSPESLATAMALAADLRKSAVIAANGDGFIGNRLFDRFHQEAMYLVEDGATPEQVDDALERFGFAIGPFRALDLVGNDIPWGVRKQRALRPVPPPQPRIGDALCEEGLFGQKTGRGWYLYDEVTPKGRPYEEVAALIARIAREQGLVLRRVDADEIVGRCVSSLIVEGLAMVAEGRAARAADIDVVYVTGYGFPAALGGPMRLGARIGTDRVLTLARQYGKLSGRSDTAWVLPAALAQTEANA